MNVMYFVRDYWYWKLSYPYFTNVTWNLVYTL